jgi:2-oxoglutarate dehydrogenase E2 component (dihydrolipoamide succinyltransferase)
VIETDKVKVDIRAPESGVITKFFANLGDTVEVGKPFFDIDSAAQGSQAKQDKKEEKKEEKKEVKE